ncbi:MAG: redox-sensing transcriptional repressor Rex [Clostridia bacterium]|nr:redox-sensing transcriptional repressor Rex [Clostridia bacterium]
MNLTLTVYRRLSLYLQYLKQLPPEVTRISATAIAKDLGLGEVLVRKELSFASSAAGRPKTGYVVKTLIHALEDFLGYNDFCRAIVVGSGKLGRAFMSSNDFSDFGFYISAGFDVDEKRIGTAEGGHPILPMEQLESYCENYPTRFAILTVPKEAAQAVCDRLVAAGIRAIWSFAPTTLNVPENVLVHYENFSSAIALLTHHLRTLEE